MELQQARSIPRTKRRIRAFALAAILFAFFFASLIGYQTYKSSLSYSAYPPVGQLVDIGDYQLHMYAAGEKTSLPTILLESGSGTPSSVSDWRYIQPELAKMTRVITYDRAGYGWSDQARNDRTSEQIVKDLHKMLEVSGEKGPFILVGHSFGGFTMQLFAHTYPDEVKGMVLLDSSIIGKNPEMSNSALFFQGALREIGVMRLMGALNILPVPEAVLSDNRSKEFLYRSFFNEDQKSELKFMATTDEDELRKVQKEGFGDIPLAIISSRAEEKEHKDWQASQDALKALSSNSKRMIVENSSHYIHHDQPEIVIESIADILNKDIE